MKFTGKRLLHALTKFFVQVWASPWKRLSKNDSKFCNQALASLNRFYKERQCFDRQKKNRENNQLPNKLGSSQKRRSTVSHRGPILYYHFPQVLSTLSTVLGTCSCSKTLSRGDSCFPENYRYPEVKGESRNDLNERARIISEPVSLRIILSYNSSKCGINY